MIEVETKFKVASGAAKVLAQLAAAPALGSYTLGEANTLEISDTYFDNEGLDLFLREAGLRIREQNGSLLVTLKIKRAPVAGATMTRLEIEGPPIVEILADIWDTLDTEGLVRQTFRTQRQLPDNISSMFDSWGFKALFKIDNQRVEREVLAADGQQVATLMLDRAVVHNEQKRGALTEIEIEASAGQAGHLPALSAALQQQFPGLLTPSDRSKYRQGIELVGLA